MKSSSELELKYQDLKDRFRVVTDLARRLAAELEIDELLRLVLTEALRLTASDAGSLYTKEGKQLAFKVAQNETLPQTSVNVKEYRFPMDKHSLVGLAAYTRETLRIDDVQAHESYDRATAAKIGYDVHTMLVVPMLDHRQDVLGVLQLMNAKDDEGRIVPYGDDTAYLAEVLASHAGTALEVARLYGKINELLDAMVRYTARAIDARDPSTAGHSSRVSKYAVQLADFHGGFTKGELKAMRYAGLYHDVGKIGVPEAVLTKADKLQPDALRCVEERFESAKRAHEVEMHLAASHGAYIDVHAAIERKNQELDSGLEFIKRIAKPSLMTDEQVETLNELAAQTFVDSRGDQRSLLEPGELESLSVRKGNLTDREREIMRSHVTMSNTILKKFPFTEELAEVPELVYTHHEKPDGSGYPRGLKNDEIPLGARILAVVDAFDALTAQDRPYKKPISVERSLEILTMEATLGEWDPDVVRLLKKAIDADHVRVTHHGEVE